MNERMNDITQGFVQRDFLFFFLGEYLGDNYNMYSAFTLSFSSSQSTDDTSVSNLSRSWMWFFSRNKNDFSEFCYVNLIITS